MDEIISDTYIANRILQNEKRSIYLTIHTHIYIYITIEMDDKKLLNELIEQRRNYRNQENYEKADALRKQIENKFNIIIEDSKNGTATYITMDELNKRKKRKRAEETIKRQKQRQQQHNILDLDNLKHVPRTRAVRNRRKQQHIKSQKARFFHFSHFIKANFLINNDYFKSINKATITLLDICGGSGNLSWELLKDNHQFATEKKSLRCIVIDPKKINFSLHKSKIILKKCSKIINNKNNNMTHHTMTTTNKVVDGDPQSNDNNNNDDDDEKQYSASNSRNVKKCEKSNQVKEQCNNFMAKGLHPKIQKKLNSMEMKIINNYLNMNIGFQQISSLFNHQFIQSNLSIWNQADVIIGLHPDEATDDIIEMSMKYFKPFICVPCCVFPNKFPNRKLKSSGKTVRQHDELIEYIMEKAREVNLLKHTSNSNKTMVYVVKEQTIDTIPGPCNVAIYGKYYVKEKV